MDKVTQAMAQGLVDDLAVTITKLRGQVWILRYHPINGSDTPDGKGIYPAEFEEVALKLEAIRDRLTAALPPPL